jgi:hypothetical protein
MLAAFGTPLNITVDELALEFFFPADSATAAFLARDRTSRDFVKEAVDVADATVVEDGDVETNHNGFLDARRTEVPGEAGLVMVRIDRTAETKPQTRKLCLHGCDELIDAIASAHRG